jgi:hypothetical protein
MISLLSQSPQALAAISSAAPQFLTLLVTAVAVAGVFFTLASAGDSEDPSDF